MTVLVVVLGVIAIAAFVWNFRRQAAAREAASAERMKAFLEQARAEAAARAGHSAAAPDAPAAIPVRQAPPPPSPPPSLLSGFGLRTPMLNAEQQALYRLLQTGLPDHLVFACVSLAAFIQPADNVVGFAREAQERRLADVLTDFVVCDASAKAVAAVQCGARSGKAAEKAAFAAACAAATGVRWVELSPQALPPPAEIRARVLG